MRSVILRGSEGSSGAHLSPESSRARLLEDLVQRHEVLQEPRELTRKPFRLEGVQPQPRESSPLELADELAALVRLYAPRRVDVDDRRPRKRRPGPPAALDVSQPPGTRVDQTPYPQASLLTLPYPDQRPLLVGRHREPP